MNRMSLTIALAFAPAALTACKGDDLQPATDAGKDAPRDTATVDTPVDGPVDTGLVLHYAFEETAGTTVMDGSTRAKHGTLSDATAWTANGRVGRGLSMSGANPPTQYVTMPNGFLMDVEDFSIAFWVKLDMEVPWGRVFDWGNGLADPANRFMYFTPLGFIGGPTPGLLTSSWGGAAANELLLNSGTHLPVGVWKHVTITGSGGTRKIFVDGFPAQVITGGPVVHPKEMEPASPNSWLGKSRFPDGGLGGTLDDFRIYRRVLTDTEIGDLAWPKLDYSWWRFDETAGMTAKESSDHNIPTVLANGVTWAAGRQGNAASFPGGAAGATGPTITLAANPLATCTTELSVSAWVKLAALNPWARIFDFGTQNQRFIYLAPTDGTGMHFAMVSPAGVFDMVTATPPIPGNNTWHHVGVTVAASGLVTLYVDGAVAMTQNSPNVRPGDFANVTEMWLGKSRFPDPYLNGAIDDLRIGCRALTADEMKNLSRP